MFPTKRNQHQQRKRLVIPSPAEVYVHCNQLQKNIVLLVSKTDVWGHIGGGKPHELRGDVGDEDDERRRSGGRRRDRRDRRSMFELIGMF
jgi:hypothetical protein